MSVAFAGTAQELRLRLRRDLLVNIVLGGLYTSVARQHRVQYLASRTTIDGTPIAQVPSAKSRWPAIVVVLVFLALRVANEFDAGPPLPVLAIAGVLLMPWLWATVVARSIGAIRWRDCALSFRAGWREVYLACWPLLVLGVAWALLQPRVAALAESDDLDWHVAAGAGVAALVAFPLLVTLAFNLKRLRFAGTLVGDCRVHWPARFRDWLRQWSLAALAVAATAVAPVLLLRRALFGPLSMDEGAKTLAIYMASLALIVLLSVPARAWHEARMFALTWDGVRVGEHARVRCALDVRAFVRLRALDTWRTLRSLGRHRAQAVVNAYRAKLAALTVEAG